MQVKEILSDCLKKLDIADFLNEETYSSSQNAIVSRLLNCLNLIYQEVVSDYFPLKYSESVNLNGEILSFSTLRNRFIKAISLENNGKNIAFCVLPSGIECNFVGTATLSYNYLPTTLTIDSSIEDYRLTSNLLSDGVVGEYYFLDNMFDLATAFDTKFRKNLSWSSTKGKEIKIKERRWGV